MSDTDRSALDTNAVLARWGVKPVSVFNLIVAVSALSLSVVSVAQNNARTHQRMVFGGFLLGVRYETFMECRHPNLYVHCPRTIGEGDFKALDPILDALFEMPVDWPNDDSNQADSPTSWADPTMPKALVLDALNVHYESKTVGRAFQIGASTVALIAMADDPTTQKDPTKRSAYASLAKNVQAVLSEEFKGICRDTIDPLVPDKTAVSKLFVCLNGYWFP